MAGAAAAVWLMVGCARSHDPSGEGGLVDATVDAGVSDGGKPDARSTWLGCDDPRCKTKCCEDEHGEFCCDYFHFIDGRPACGDQPPCINGEFCCPRLAEIYPDAGEVCGSARDALDFCGP